MIFEEKQEVLKYVLDNRLSRTNF